MPTTISFVKVHEEDNVAIASGPNGFQKDDVLTDRTQVLESVPMGHKVALEDIPKGGGVRRYGEIIGYTYCDIKKGECVSADKLLIPQPPDLDNLHWKSGSTQKHQPLPGFTFEGYRNKDGSVGTKNILGITTSVHCVSGMADHVAEKIKKELLPDYHNVDDVVALNHTYGCGVAIDAPGAAIPIRTIKNLAQNPNFGDQALVIGLGCEKLRPEQLIENSAEAATGMRNDILYMQDERFEGFSEMVDGAMELASSHLKILNQRQRETCPVADLVVGMQCGGSDALSGITGNPVAGFAADLLVRAGAKVMFSEVTEVRDAVHLLVPRCESEQIAGKLKSELNWYDDYLKTGEADRTANPSPGNKAGGLSNVVEKALGSIAKSGSSPIVDVIGPGEKIRKSGLTFAATPASDFICGTLQLAAGMNLHVFITGRGTPYGLASVPVIKIGTNSKLSKRWHDLIDLDAGKVATGDNCIEEMGWELFHLMLDVASGKKQVAADKLGLHNDLVLFNPGPVT